MIYGNKEDRDLAPSYRDGICLNCEKGWWDHSGWACQEGRPRQFSKLPLYQSFVTREMLTVPSKKDSEYTAAIEHFRNTPMVVRVGGKLLHVLNMTSDDTHGVILEVNA